jgi:2-oxoglutarate ferredoxin oxidoreductase subunit delta
MTDQDTVHDDQAAQGGEPEFIPEEGILLPGQKGTKKQFDIDIFRAWCKSCGICSAFCPKHCIQLDDEGTPTVRDAGDCTGCGWCELHCPDFAISVHPRPSDRNPPGEAD